MQTLEQAKLGTETPPVAEYPRVLDINNLNANEQEPSTPRQKHIPEQVLNYVEAHNNELLTFRGQFDLLRPKQVEFATQVASIQRDFIKEIMSEDYELMLFTGSTAQIVKNSLLVAARSSETITSTSLPATTEWCTSRYFTRIESGPNAVVYKEVARKDIDTALVNVQNAEIVSETRSALYSDLLLDPHTEPGTPISTESKMRVVAAVQQELAAELTRDAYDLSFATNYRIVESLKFVDQTTLNEITAPCSPDQLNKFRHMCDVAHQIVDPAVGIARNFADELPGLETTIKGVIQQCDDGTIKTRTRDSIFHGKISMVVPERGETRVALMKALYPEAITQLYNTYPSEPKHIVMYDNAIVTGTKLNEYVEFFSALGMDSNVDYYSIFAKPNYNPPENRRELMDGHLHIGIRKDFEDDDTSLIKLRGPAHDAEMSFTRIGTNESITTASELKAYVGYKFRTLTEYTMLPESLEMLRERYKNFPTRDDETFIAALLTTPDNRSIPQTLVPTAELLGKHSATVFEKALSIQEEEKQYFQAVSSYLHSIDSQMVNHKSDLIATDDYTLFLTMQALTHCGEYEGIDPSRVKLLRAGVKDLNGQKTEEEKTLHLIIERWPDKYSMRQHDGSYQIETTVTNTTDTSMKTEERAAEWKNTEFQTDYYKEKLTGLSEKLAPLAKGDQEAINHFIESFAKDLHFYSDEIPEITNAFCTLSGTSGDRREQISSLLTNFITASIQAYETKEEFRVLPGTEGYEQMSEVAVLIANNVRSMMNGVVETLDWKPDFTSQSVEEIRTFYNETQLPKYEKTMTDLATLTALKEFYFLHDTLDAGTFEAEQITKALTELNYKMPTAIFSETSVRLAPNVVTLEHPESMRFYPGIYGVPVREKSTEEMVEFFRNVEKTKYLADLTENH